MAGILRQTADGCQLFYEWYEALHTRVDILLKAPEPSYTGVKDVATRIKFLIDEIECEGNCFDPASLLSKFNRLTPGDTMPGGRHLYDMLEACRRYRRLTGGMFDVTFATVGHNPDTAESVVLLPHKTLARTSDSVRVNLSGFIKGYAIDRIADLLAQCGIGDAVINLGNSSILAVGNVPVKLSRRCLTTSGNPAERTVPTVDPRTHLPVTTGRVVSVVTDSGAEGEVLAKVLLMEKDIDAAATRLKTVFGPHFDLTE